MKHVIPALLFCLPLLMNGSDLFRNPALFPVERKEKPKHEKIVLIQNGKANFALVRDAAKESSLRLPNQRSSESAANLLQEGFRRCFGVSVPILDVNDKTLSRYRYLFLVGGSVLTEKLGMKPLSLPKGGFELKTFPGGVALAGYDGSQIPRFYENMPGAGVTLAGTRHGAADFLERFLGCRFYYPGELGEIFPKASNLILEPVHYQDYPHMLSRDNFHHMASTFRKTKQWEPLIGPYGDVSRFAALWRLERGSMYVANHCPQPDQWLKAHPDKKELIFYRAPNGHLYYTPSDGHGGKYIDVTNLKVADLLIEDWKKFFASAGKDAAPWTWDKPNRDYVAFGQADSSVPLPDMLENPTVKKLGLITEEHKKNQAGMYSDIYARFFQYLGERLAKELPGVRLGLIPYSEYTEPPRLAPYRKLPDNIDLRVCLMQLPGRVRNKEIVREYTKLLKGWSEAQNNRPIHSLWLYNTPDNPFARAMNTRFLGEVSKAFHPYFSGKDVIYGFWFDMEWFYYYSIYAGLRTLWNPDIDIDAILAEHWSMMYGAAATPVKAFHDLLLESYLKYYVPSRERVVAYPPSVLDRLEQYRAAAEKAVPGDSLEGRRVRLFMEPWPKAIAAMRGQINYERPVYKAFRISGERPNAMDWEAAPLIPMVNPSGDPAPIRYPVRAKLLWNTKGIFGRVESSGNLLASDQKRVFDNCNFEFFLSPGDKREKYFQWVISADGQLHSGNRQVAPIAMAYDRHWKCRGFEYRVQKGENSYLAEFFIPFDGLRTGAPRTYNGWYFSLIRNKRSEPQEVSASCQTRGENHNLDQFGILKFVGERKK